jgi:hypothetical protein
MADDPTTAHPVTPEPQPAVPATPGVAPSPTAAPTWSGAAMAPVQPVQPVVTPAKPKSGSSGRWLNVLLGVALVFAIGGVAFAIGRTTAPAAAATGGRGNFNGGFVGGGNGPTGSFVPGGNGGFFGGRGGGGLAISGTVKSVDGDKLTITTDNGQEVTLTTADSTTYHTQAPASASDVNSGDKVSVKVSIAGRATGGTGNGNGGTGNGGTGNGNGGNGNGNAPGGLTGTASDVTIIP